MKLEGSCQCGKVSFSVDSETPYPYMFCYCSICRKTTGAITCNIMGRRETLRVQGKRHLRCHHAVLRRPRQKPLRSKAERWFCGECGSHLYLLDDHWPNGVWPNAAVIDSELPTPPEHVHLMLNHKPVWVPVPGKGPRYPEYPELSIAEWHEKKRLTVRERQTPERKRQRKMR